MLKSTEGVLIIRLCYEQLQKKSHVSSTELTTIAFEKSWWASSSLTAILATLCERIFWWVVQSADLQMPFGISLRPKPRRNAPVTRPNVLEQAMAKPGMFPILHVYIHSLRVEGRDQWLEIEAWGGKMWKQFCRKKEQTRPCLFNSCASSTTK